jgi:hypothetical protein
MTFDQKLSLKMMTLNQSIFQINIIRVMFDPNTLKKEEAFFSKFDCKKYYCHKTNSSNHKKKKKKKKSNTKNKIK